MVLLLGMKAVQITSFGKPDVIHITDVPVPMVTPNHVLVQVHAASINAVDWKISTGAYAKMMPVTFPFTLGGDFSGVVTEVPEGVSEFAVGDEVYGNAIATSTGSGSMAEYVNAPTKSMSKKPTDADWVQAAALPLVGVSALQALVEEMHLSAGQKILIHGGAGGIGSTAIQLARHVGAYVITTASGDDMDFVKSLGADEVIDYHTQKFEDMVKDIDCVYDTVGGETAEKSLGILKKGGIIVSMLGQPNPEKAKELGIQSIGQQTRSTTDRLMQLTKLVDEGAIKIQIDKVYPIDKAREAFVYQEDVHPKGKVVIQII